MFQFCFNDCIPQNGNEHSLMECLSKTLTHFDKIKKQFPDTVEGIITDKLPSQVILNSQQYSLHNCILNLGREIKRVAFTHFNKYPVEGNFVINNEDDLLRENYSIIIDTISYNAINAKIVSENEGVLFTLAIHNDLKQNTLTIMGDKEQSYQVLNLFGEDTNTHYISAIKIK